MASEKRPRVESLAPAVVVVRATKVVKDLEALYGGMTQDFLWDTSKFQMLVQPTAYYSVDSPREYRYIGRAKAKDLLPVVLRLQAGAELQIQGAKGSGKSTAMSSLAGYMLGNLKKKVVYICAARFVAAPVETLRHGLLVASGDEDLASVTKVTELQDWCSAHGLDPLLFVVDDWDKFDNYPALEASLLEAVSGDHILVKLSSTNSRERRIFQASDKFPPTFDFDGPYTLEELQTWIAQSSLPQAKLESLDCLTGGMPRLLRYYEEMKGNGRLFRQKIEEPYTSKLFDRLIRLQTTKAQLASAAQMVTTGVRGIHLIQPVDLTCFYKDGNKFKLLSPYLRSRAEYYIMEQEKALQSGLEYAAIQTWAGAVRMDCIIRGRNPARAGWNVEGLIIAVMRYQKRMWDGLPFVHCKTYERGREAALLRSVTSNELSDGVLVVPIAFNERAVDVIYLKLDTETATLTIKAVQITISKWKNKRRKGSHKVWQEQVLPRWLSEKWALEHQFIYVTPEKLNRDDVGVNRRDLFSYLAACHAPADVEEDGSDNEDLQYGTEEYEGVDLVQVKSHPVEFKKLGDVHGCLSEFDRFLDLKEPSKLEKKDIRQCGGLVSENGIDRPCLRWSRTDAQFYYCCPSHEQSVARRAQISLQ